MCDSCEIRGLLFANCVEGKLLTREPELGLWEVISLIRRDAACTEGLVIIFFTIRRA